jgi:hypothetical protein
MIANMKNLFGWGVWAAIHRMRLGAHGQGKVDQYAGKSLSAQGIFLTHKG